MMIGLRRAIWFGRSFSIPLRRLFVFVCSGNTIRSPMAQAICNAEIASRFGVPLESLGQAGHQSRERRLDRPAGRAPRRGSGAGPGKIGLPVLEHRSRNLTHRLAQRAEAIFCMTEEQRSELTAMFPATQPKSYRLHPDADHRRSSRQDSGWIPRLCAADSGLVRRRLDGLGVCRAEARFPPSAPPLFARPALRCTLRGQETLESQPDRLEQRCRASPRRTPCARWRSIRWRTPSCGPPRSAHPRLHLPGSEGRGDVYSFVQVAEETARRAGALQALGLRRGDRLGMVVIEPEDFVLTFLACLRVGVVPVPFYPPLGLGNFAAYSTRIGNCWRRARPGCSSFRGGWRASSGRSSARFLPRNADHRQAPGVRDPAPVFPSSIRTTSPSYSTPPAPRRTRRE